MTTALRASDSSTRAALPARNPGTPLDLSFLTRTRINRSAVERRAATLPTRRTVKKEWQAAWLLRAITLHGPDDALRRRHARQRAAAVRQGAPAGARRPARGARRAPSSTSQVGAVCVYHALRARPRSRRCDGIGHPGRRGLDRLPGRADAASSCGSRRSRRRSRRAPSEIDIVITRAHVLTGDWQALYDEVQRLPRGLRRRAHEGDPRHRRAGDAAQRGAREPGVA